MMLNLKCERCKPILDSHWGLLVTVEIQTTRRHCNVKERSRGISAVKCSPSTYHSECVYLYLTRLCVDFSTDFIVAPALYMILKKKNFFFQFLC